MKLHEAIAELSTTCTDFTVQCLRQCDVIV